MMSSLKRMRTRHGRTALMAPPVYNPRDRAGNYRRRGTFRPSETHEHGNRAERRQQFKDVLTHAQRVEYARARARVLRGHPLEEAPDA